jgi:hypothetical protein
VLIWSSLTTCWCHQAVIERFCVGLWGAAILFGVSMLWYWGTKRKVDALESQRVLLADLFKLKSPDDECALPYPSQLPYTNL